MQVTDELGLTLVRRFMPELPEVETIRAILKNSIIGETITNVQINTPRIIKNDVDFFTASLINQTFIDVKRIGKYLIFELTNDLVLLSHLRMEGKYIEVSEKEENSRFARVIFTFKSGKRLCYDDSRKFGTMELSSKQQYLNLPSLTVLGPEPFVADVDKVYRQFQRRNNPIKLSLLDQSIMTGLGNIYVDEVLFATKIHPLTPTNLLNLAQTKEVIEASIETLNKAIKAGGSTIRSYTPAKGMSGKFQLTLNAYGKEGSKCVRCHHLMKKIFVGGRGTTFCPSCQRVSGVGLAIAITGHKGAGKSTILDYLKSLGHKTLSADALVHELYLDKTVILGLESRLNQSFSENGLFNRALLRAYLLDHPEALKVVNNYIHPLVKERIKLEISKRNAANIYVEVPLLFSAKIHELFDFIIGIEIPSQLQIERLKLRGDDIKINPDAQYIKNRHKVDYIIINDGTKEELINKFNEFKV